MGPEARSVKGKYCEWPIQPPHAPLTRSFPVFIPLYWRGASWSDAAVLPTALGHLQGCSMLLIDSETGWNIPIHVSAN